MPRAALTVLVAAALAAGAPAQTLDYTTTWLGNTYGGGAKWVQNFIEGLYVAPDGTCYAASGWDEACREFGIYKGGNVVGNCADTHGWGTGGGPAVTASDRYLFIAHSHGNEGGNLKGEKYPPKGFTWFGVSRRTLDGKPAPFDGGRGRFGDMCILHQAPEKADAQARGLAVDAKGRLYVSDPSDGAIKVFDAASMSPVAHWKAARPGPLALDSKGTLWVLQAETADAGAAPCVRRYAADGRPMPQTVAFAKDQVPTAIAIHRKTGALLVTDNGPAQQVLVYTNIDRAPRPSGTVGVKGGLWADPVPGRAGPDRLAGPMGVGTDAAGNLYVGCNTPAGGSVLRAFTPNTRLMWELLGLEFVDAADTDPATDGADVFTTECRYTLDWSKSGPGRQWTWRSMTVDPFRYPDDPRLHEKHHDFTDVLFRRVQDRPLLVVRGMFQHAMVIYRLDGETAVPSAMFAKGPYRNGAWKDVPQPEKGRWIWRDSSGDGRFQREEFLEADGVREPESWAWWMDTRGDVWQGDQDGKEPIRHYPLQGFDAHGNPIYSRAASVTCPMPEPLTHLLRMEYHPETDVMYLTGHTKDRPKTGGEWGQVGTEILRFDGWSTGNRTPRWRAALPYDPPKNVSCKSFATAGDYAFAVECRNARVLVFDAGTGREVGQMTPGPEVAKESGWVDFPDAIRAFRRKGGEYLVFVEEDAKAKIIVYRWKPKAAK